MPFDPRQVRLERVNLTLTYHATWSFFGLKGIIAERWAHGPLFGAVTEVGTTQLNLSPAPDEDERLLGVIGYRTSALLAEGKRWTREVPEIAPNWFADIVSALKPQRFVNVGAELLGLYPVRDPWRATQRLRLQYYNDEALSRFAGSPSTHAAVEIFSPDETPMRTIVMGVLGPPHRGSYFTFPQQSRDDTWWLAVRLNYAEVNDEGLQDPLERLERTRTTAETDWHRISREVLPELIS